jgi:hypothetical protein
MSEIDESEYVTVASDEPTVTTHYANGLWWATQGSLAASAVTVAQAVRRVRYANGFIGKTADDLSSGGGGVPTTSQQGDAREQEEGGYEPVLGDSDIPCAPCPFCGSGDTDAGAALSETAGGRRRVQAGCMDCGAVGPEAISPQSAAQKWAALRSSPAQDHAEAYAALAAIRQRHNGYNAEMRAAMPDLKEPASPAEALDDLLAEERALALAEADAIARDREER